MSDDISNIHSQALYDMEHVQNSAKLEAFRIKYLGKNGLLTDLMKNLKNIIPGDRPAFGKSLNKAKNDLENRLLAKKNQFEKEEISTKIRSDVVDITLPGKKHTRGKKHPITQVMDELIEIFKQLGFSVAYGPDIETEYYNFEALNIPPFHPSRDMWSTLWLEDGLLLRTHTSPVQIRIMEKDVPPIAYIMPGRVYRRDADVTHSPVFHQLEGLLVDSDVAFSDLKGVLTAFIHAVFGKERKIRFRPSYFPFTEPSAEIDVECGMCKGQGCRVCSQTGWLEILGAGMVDPNVFKCVNVDPEKYSGFAFGMGIERIAMLKYGIDDIRLFFENDMRFLRQF